MCNVAQMAMNGWLWEASLYGVCVCGRQYLSDKCEHCQREINIAASHEQ